jgi:hypothetical protein
MFMNKGYKFYFNIWHNESDDIFKRKQLGITLTKMFLLHGRK